MLLDGGAQRAGAVAVDQVDGGLPVQDGVVDEGIRLLDGLVDGQAQQVALHLGLPADPLKVPAVAPAAVAGLAGVALLRLGLGGDGRLFQLVGLLEPLEGHLGLDDAGPDQNVAVAVGQGQHGGQLAQFGDADLLTHPDLLQGDKVPHRVMHHVGMGKQFGRLLFGDLPGALGPLLGAGLFVLLDLAQLVGQAVGLVFHLLGQGAGLGAGGFQLVLALTDQLFLLFLGVLQLMGRLVTQPLHLVLAGLELQLEVVQLAQHRVQPLVVGRKVLLGRLDDPLGDAQLFADEEGVGFARHADAQLVGGPQGLEVEFAAGVDDAGRFEGKDLQLGVVGGGHQQNAAAAQLLDDGDGQSRAFGRVGAGAQLVQQHKGAGGGQFQNAGDLGHVAREGGQALLDALLVADVHQILLKDADLAALVRRDQKAALGHGAEQTGRLEGDGLAAGVGAGNDEGIVVAAQGDVHRHAPGRVDQGVAGPHQREGAVVADRGLEGLHLQGHPGLGQQDVDLQHGLVAELELRLDGGHLAGEGGQDPLDLLRLLGAVLQNAGVGLDDGLRLDEDGGAGGGDVVDDAADLAAVFALDRHDVPPVADGDDRLLQVLGGLHVVDQALQPVADGVFGGADLFAQLGQGVRGGVGHGVGREDGVRDLLFQPGLGGQGVEQIVGGQGVMVGRAVPGAQVLEVAQRAGHFQQLPHREDAALDGAGSQPADPFHAAKAGRTILDEQCIDGVGLIQHKADFVGGALRGQFQHFGSGLFADAAGGRPLDDLVQFQCF